MTSFLKEVQDTVKAARKRERDLVDQFDYETPIQKLLVATVQHIREYPMMKSIINFGADLKMQLQIHVLAFRLQRAFTSWKLVGLKKNKKSFEGHGVL